MSVLPANNFVVAIESNPPQVNYFSHQPSKLTGYEPVILDLVIVRLHSIFEIRLKRAGFTEKTYPTNIKRSRKIEVKNLVVMMNALTFNVSKTNENKIIVLHNFLTKTSGNIKTIKWDHVIRCLIEFRNQAAHGGERYCQV